MRIPDEFPADDDADAESASCSSPATKRLAPVTVPPASSVTSCTGRPCPTACRATPAAIRATKRSRRSDPARPAGDRIPSDRPARRTVGSPARIHPGTASVTLIAGRGK